MYKYATAREAWGHAPQKILEFGCSEIVLLRPFLARTMLFNTRMYVYTCLVGVIILSYTSIKEIVNHRAIDSS